MNKLYMGIDAGSVFVKGVIIDEYDNIITSSYLDTSGDPICATKNIIKNMCKDIDFSSYQVVNVGTTGSARKLIGTMLGTKIIKNEIMAHAIGSVRLYPNVRTILDIGGKDSKIILINNGVVSDYSINSLCSSGTGSFISSFAKRLGVSLEEVSSMALKSKNIVDISSRCVVFAETDMIDKIQKGYKKEDIFAGICRSVSVNYINSIVKGKKIKGPILFNGGVSKNKAVVNNLEELIGEKIIVDKNSHLMGAFGMALMARECNTENVFDFDIDNLSLETKVILCEGCSNNCEIVTVYRNNQIIDCWGNHCEKGDVFKKV